MKLRIEIEGTVVADLEGDPDEVLRVAAALPDLLGGMAAESKPQLSPAGPGEWRRGARTPMPPLEELARRYLDAKKASRNARRELGIEYGVSERTITRWLAEVRAAGLLPGKEQR